MHRRKFHAPTGIDAADTVWIVIESQSCLARLCCNGTFVGNVQGQASFEITHLLKSTNQLEMLFSAGENNPHRGSVCLEIRCPRDVK